jgi:long-chain acyl-CoA synthetase
VTQHSVPALYEVAERDNITDFVVTNAVEAPDRAVFARPQGDAWIDVTARAFLAEVIALAKGLIAQGVGPGDRIAILCRTRYEWTLIDFAGWFAGAVVVPIYETSSPEQVQWILSDSGAVACFVETAHNEAVVRDLQRELPALTHVWQIDAGAVDAVTAAGTSVADADVDARRAGLRADSLATIIYTSGTTGRPKGCELTHGNFVAEVRNVVGSMRELFCVDRAATLLFIPLAHVFARVIEVGCVYARVKLGHTADVKRLVEDLGTFHPTFILSVPRVFEKVYNTAAQKAEADGKGKIFARAAAVAVSYSESLESGGPGIGLRLQHAVFDKLVYGKLRAAFGGKLEYAVSGGAALGTRLGHFFRGIGVTVLEGYGLTETTAGATVNRPGALKVGTVGPPVPGTTVRVAPDGEVQIKGPIVFQRYFNNPDATTATFDGEWFSTGDLGELDADGYLRITGRKKEILVTAGGKNVAPAVLEDRLRAHVLVSQCIVLGDGQPYISALVTLDPDALPGWLRQRGKEGLAHEQVVADEDVVAAVQSAVDEANKAVSRAEAIKRFTILVDDFTVETGHLTPSLKLKRAQVMKDYATEVDALYR